MIKENVKGVVVNFAIVAACAGAASFLCYFFLSLAGQRIGTNLRTAYFSRLLRQEIGFFDLKNSGDLVLAINQNSFSIQESYSSKLAIFFQNITQFIVGLALAFSVNWELSLIMLSTSPLNILGYYILSKFVALFAKKAEDGNDRSATVAAEVVSSIRTVRSMGCEHKEKKRYVNQMGRISLHGFLKAFFEGSAFGSFSLIMWGTAALGYWYG